ncbi:copper chaperone [Collariella sp. IMI 366227]|nr:copper chaperone [Collariella sp. IMI 366227]
MTCEGCAKDITGALNKLPGITKVETNVADQLVSVEGIAIVDAIQATGRDAILRGWINERLVRGLVRMVQVSPTSTLIDLTIRGVPPGTYRATIRAYGNLQSGAKSTGPVWDEPLSSGSQSSTAVEGEASALSAEEGGEEGKATPTRGFLATLTVAPSGYGSVFVDRPFQVWEVIGRAVVVTRDGEGGEKAEGKGLENGEDTVVGVIARSAGVWDNDKTVCSCTGKTLWEERRDEVGKGML